jgi:hypothetical protein
MRFLLLWVVLSVILGFFLYEWVGMGMEERHLWVFRNSVERVHIAPDDALPSHGVKPT